MGVRGRRLCMGMIMEFGFAFIVKRGGGPIKVKVRYRG